MKNTKEILGRIKNIILWASVVLSMLILISELIYNNYTITFILKILAILNLYCFFKVNAERLINN